MSTPTLTELSNAYETAEADFLATVRRQSSRAATAGAARRVASAAADFNSEAYRKFYAEEEDAWMPLDHLTERTEVLSELWDDIASAYAGQTRGSGRVDL